MTKNLAGMDDLREWLEAHGFRSYHDSLKPADSLVNWYACRKTQIEARECECNDGKNQQIVIRPYHWNINGQEFRGAEVDLTGETGGIWYKLMAYSLKEDELKGRLPQIEAALVSAWNALLRKDGE